jgi:outer membrane protein assembly factor BamB
MRRELRRRGSVFAVIIVSFVIASCSPGGAPEPTPTLEPVLPLLPSPTSQASLPAPAATGTPVPLGQATPLPAGQATPQPIGGAPSSACPTGAVRLPGLRYGVNIVPGDTNLTRSLDQARDMSAGWVRATLRWSDLEPQQGAYRWEQLDALVEGAQTRGLRLLLAVTQAPAWADATGGLPEKPEDFGTFMGALANHATGKISAYEIWREPNVAPSNSTQPADPKDYVELLQAASTAIKHVDPCALVLNGALRPAASNTPSVTDDLDFYRDMLAYNGGAVRTLYDILAVQLNTSGQPGKGKWPRDDMAQSRGFFGHVNVVRDEMTAADEADKQVWVVQVGYSTAGEHAVAPEQQAENLTGLLDLSRQGNPWISGFFARDLGAASDQDAGFSLLNPDGAPRPAYTALRDYYASARAQRELAEPIIGTDLMVLWRFQPNPEPIGQLVAGQDGAVYTQSANGYVRAIDPNGALRLTVKPSRKRVPGVTADAQGRIYATGDNGALSAYTPGGDFLWTVLTDGTATTALLLSSDERALYTGTNKEHLDAYATDDGHKLWGAPLGGIAGTPALASDGTLYIGSTDGALHAIAPDGTPRWRYPTEGFVQFAPALGGNTIYGATDRGIAFALDASGQQRWRVELGAPSTGLTIGVDGTVYATTADGTLHALAPDGTSRWSTPLGGGHPTAPAAAPDGRLYAGAEDGRLRVVTPDGKIAGVFDLKAPLNIAPLIGRDGAIYVAVGERHNMVLAFGTAELKKRYNAL